MGSIPVGVTKKASTDFSVEAFFFGYPLSNIELSLKSEWVRIPREDVGELAHQRQARAYPLKAEFPFSTKSALAVGWNIAAQYEIRF